MLEDDSSDGVNEVRIFCFDWLILNTTKSNMRFMAHDSRIFANMDPRQRKVLFKIVNEVCKDSEFQYICSVNQDTLDSVKGLMEDNEYKEMIADNIILELNDDAPESKLLGIQIDIDLEDKDKAEYDLKHELIAAQIQLDESSRKVDQLKDEINELQKQIVKLEAKADQQKD